MSTVASSSTSAGPSATSRIVPQLVVEDYDNDKVRGGEEDDDDDELDSEVGSEISMEPQPMSLAELQAEVDRRNERNLTKQDVELGQYVRDLYAGGARLFDKETFREVEAALARNPRPEVIQIRSSTHYSLFLVFSSSSPSMFVGLPTNLLV